MPSEREFLYVMPSLSQIMEFEGNVTWFAGPQNLVNEWALYISVLESCSIPEPITQCSTSDASRSRPGEQIPRAWI